MQLLFAFGRRAAKAREERKELLVLQPGVTVSALEKQQNALDGILPEQKKAPQPLLVDPLADLRDKAKALVREDPERAVMLMRAWLSADLEKGTTHHG
jgi:flagellar biosynthesis/type III secretory pathway M-ring protein FliF/YscJ